MFFLRVWLFNIYLCDVLSQVVGWVGTSYILLRNLISHLPRFHSHPLFFECLVLEKHGSRHWVTYPKTQLKKNLMSVCSCFRVFRVLSSIIIISMILTFLRRSAISRWATGYLDFRVLCAMSFVRTPWNGWNNNILSGENAEEDSSGELVSQMRLWTMETAFERLQRYLSSELCEVSDPEEWSVLHYGLGSPVSEGAPGWNSRIVWSFEILWWSKLESFKHRHDNCRPCAMSRCQHTSSKRFACALHFLVPKRSSNNLARRGASVLRPWANHSTCWPHFASMCMSVVAIPSMSSWGASFQEEMHNVVSQSWASWVLSVLQAQGCSSDMRASDGSSLGVQNSDWICYGFFGLENVLFKKNCARSTRWTWWRARSCISSFWSTPCSFKWGCEQRSYFLYQGPLHSSLPQVWYHGCFDVATDVSTMQLQPKPKLYTQSVYKFFKHFKAHGKPILHPAVIRILGDLKT